MATDNFIQLTETREKAIRFFAFVIALLAAAFLYLGLTASVFCQHQDAGSIVLAEKINPNTASVAGLVQLPGIGITRAWAIVEYRENFSSENSDSSAFQNCDDLMKIKGIGPKTVEAIKQWLEYK
ncbi:MAG: ComEA family DNA-binding protein [Planctomycetota bacterium]|jgi:competence ComEA-like helix-hairpin-helix protein